MALFPPSRLPSWAQNWAQNCEQSWAPRCQLYLLCSDVRLQCLSGSRLVGPLYVWLQGPCDFRHVRGKCSRPGRRAAAFSISTELLAQVFNCRRFNPPPPPPVPKSTNLTVSFIILCTNGFSNLGYDTINGTLVLQPINKSIKLTALCKVLQTSSDTPYIKFSLKWRIQKRFLSIINFAKFSQIKLDCASTFRKNLLLQRQSKILFCSCTLWHQ